MLGKRNSSKKIEVQNATSVQEASNENENAFVTRATYSTIPSAPPSNDYLPPSANWITPELRKKWGIKYEDFFTIFYKDTDELLDAFQEELCGSGHERDNAVQRRNQVFFLSLIHVWFQKVVIIQYLANTLINQKCYGSTSSCRSKNSTFIFLISFLVEMKVTLVTNNVMFTFLPKTLQFFQCSMILFYFQVYNSRQGDIMLLIFKISHIPV